MFYEAIAPYTQRCGRRRRSVYIVFDQDAKASTQRNVRTQVLKLGAALEADNRVLVLEWDRALGKGIDDVFVGQGNRAQAWLDERLLESTPLSSYRRQGHVQQAIATLEQLNTLSYPIERKTVGDYLPPLPDLQSHTIHVLDASMNAGKTTRIGADWVTRAIAQGWNVLVLSPLNSLGRQTAKYWSVPHIHDFGTDADSQQALWAMVSAQHGLVCCPNSLHRLPDWFWRRPLLLILDEANQVIEQLNEGHTLGHRWARIQERFYHAARQAIAAGAIVLSEDGLPNRAVRFIEAVSGSDQVRVIQHRKQGNPWRCTVFSGQVSGFRSRLLHQVEQGDRLLIVTASQQEGKRLERVLAQRYAEAKVVRIDSETNECGTFNRFFETPDLWLQEQQPQVLILSPSAKSGISIEGGISAANAYFQSVWGYFPTLGTDTHVQMLGRYRPPVPRFLFCPPFIYTSGDEALRYPRSIKRRLHNNARAIASVYEIEQLAWIDDRQAEIQLTIESAVLDYIAEARAVQGAQKSIGQAAIIHRLEAGGHEVMREKLEHQPPIVELWNQVQASIWRDDAEAIASTRIEARHTLDWAYQTLDALDSTTETRRIARKVLWRDEFPGVTFDDAGDCYTALCDHYGAMRRGVLMQARAENLEATQAGDRPAAEAALTGSICALHHVPKTYARARLLALTGIVQLLDGATYSNLNPKAIAIKQRALHWQRELAYWLRLTIKATQTPVEICNKLIRKFGLKAVAIARPGQRGTQHHRIYQVEGLHCPLRQRLLAAARQKLQAAVSTKGKGNFSIQTVDTPPPPAGMPSDLQELWAIATTDEAREALIQASKIVQMRQMRVGYEPEAKVLTR